MGSDGIKYPAACHPDRPNKSYGLCASCYKKKRYWADPEKYRTIVKRYRRNNLEKAKTTQKNSHRKRVYGITYEKFLDMANERENKCDICGVDKGTTLHIDHNHVTGEIRGLLCNNCNRCLGWFEARLAGVLDYMKISGTTLAQDNLNYDPKTTQQVPRPLAEAPPSAGLGYRGKSA